MGGKNVIAVSEKEVGAARSLLELRDVNVHFGSTRALSGVNLRINEGDFVSVVGPSGCGKSTLLHVVAGFIPPDEGTVLLNGEPIRGPGADRTVVLQQPTLFPWLTVFENIELGPKARGVGKAERREVVEHYLALVGLSEVKDRPPYELSGGMQQRVSLARALANDSKILLVDEPFGALDALTRNRMQNEIVRIWAETKMTVLFVTHDVEEATFCSTSIIMMMANPGRIIDRITVPFSRLYAEQQESSRALKSRADFIEKREFVLGAILQNQ